MSPEDDLVLVICGIRTDGKESVNDTAAIHRAAILALTVAWINDPRVKIDFSDLDRKEFERAWDTIERYRKMGHNVHYIIGGDQITDEKGDHPLREQWYRGEELFQTGHFVIFKRPDYKFEIKDLPPNHEMFEAVHPGSSSKIRLRCFNRLDISEFVIPQVAQYIGRYQLYTGRPSTGEALFKPQGPAIIICDESRDRATELKDLVERVNTSRVGEPDHIIVIGGDGFMIDTIRDFGHLRLPMLGLNAGTTGFLLNDGTLEELEERLRAGRFVVYQQPLLQALIEDQDGELLTCRAVNEVFVHRATARSISMRVTINRVERFANLSGDGLMLSTAAGSTGWSYFAGGDQILIGTPSLVLTGDKTGVHGLRWVTGKVPIHSRVVIELQNTDWRPGLVYVDGEELPNRVKAITLHASHAYAVELAFFPQTDLAEKHMRRQFAS